MTRSRWRALGLSAPVGAAFLVRALVAWADPDAAVTVADDAAVVGDAAVDAGFVDANDDANVADAAPLAVAASDVVVPAPPPPAPVALAPVDRTRIANYDLDVRLDPRAHTLTARGTLTWTNPSTTPATDLWFHLYLNGFEGPETLFLRSSRGTSWEPSHTHWGSLTMRTLRVQGTSTDLLARSTYDPRVPGDRTQLHVPLTTPIAPGATVVLEVAWDARLPELISRTGYHDSFHMVAQWFPKLAVREDDGRWATFPFHAYSEFYADFGRYDVRVTVPRGFTVGATGQLAEPPVATEAGVRHHYVQDRVHDFAFTAWDHFRERRSDAGETAVRVLYGPGDESVAERVSTVMRDASPRFARRFGPYPYPTLTVLIPPRGATEAGGMEYPTFITTDGAWWQLRRERYIEYVTVHEYGHQYFYGLLASNEHDHPFLDEGFCEYATARVMEDLYGSRGSSVDLPLVGPPLDVWAEESFESAQIAFPVPVTTAADAFPSFGRYGRVVYSRTATVLRTAEASYGPERFAAALRLYTERARFRHPTPDTFLDTMRDTLGAESVERFFRPALTTPFRVDLAVTEAESHAAGSRFAGRVVVEASGGPTLPVDVRLRRVDGGESRVRWDPAVNPTWVIPYAGGAALASAEIDPEGRFAIDANRLNNARRASGRPDGDNGDTTAFTARIAWWVSNLLRLVGP